MSRVLPLAGPITCTTIVSIDAHALNVLTYLFRGCDQPRVAVNSGELFRRALQSCVARNPTMSVTIHIQAQADYASLAKIFGVTSTQLKSMKSSSVPKWPSGKPHTAFLMRTPCVNRRLFPKALIGGLLFFRSSRATHVPHRTIHGSPILDYTQQWKKERKIKGFENRSVSACSPFTVTLETRLYAYIAPLFSSTEVFGH